MVLCGWSLSSVKFVITSTNNNTLHTEKLADKLQV